MSDVKIKRRISMSINKLIDINSYVGLRHKLTLPFMVNVQDLMLIHNVVNVFVIEELI